MKTGLIFKDKTIPYAPVKKFTTRDIVDEIKRMEVPIRDEDKPMGSGSASDPYRMHSIKHWAAAARDPSAAGRDLYDIAGQLNERGYRTAAKNEIITPENQNDDSLAVAIDFNSDKKRAEQERQNRLREEKRIKQEQKAAALAAKRAKDLEQKALAEQKKKETEAAAKRAKELEEKALAEQGSTDTGKAPIAMTPEIAEQRARTKALKQQKRAEAVAKAEQRKAQEALEKASAASTSASATASATNAPASVGSSRPSPTSSPPPSDSPPESNPVSPRIGRVKDNRPRLPPIQAGVALADSEFPSTRDPGMSSLTESRYSVARSYSQPFGFSAVGGLFDRRPSQGDLTNLPSSPLWAKRTELTTDQDWADIASATSVAGVDPERKVSRITTGSKGTRDTTFSTRWVNYITAVTSAQPATGHAPNGVSLSGRARLHPMADTKERPVYARKYDRLQAEFQQRYSEENQQYTNESMSKEMARELRDMLQGQPTRSYASSELPGTAGALFLGEVARSTYMLPIGLMEVDLVQVGAEYGRNDKKLHTFEKMLSDPNNPASREGAKHPMARDGSSKLSRNMFDLKKDNAVRDRAVSIVAAWVAHRLSKDPEWSVAIDRTVEERLPPVPALPVQSPPAEDVTSPQKKKQRSKAARRARAEARLKAKNQLSGDAQATGNTRSSADAQSTGDAQARADAQPAENAESRNAPAGKTKADFRERVAALLKERCATFDCLLIEGNTIRYSLPQDDQPWLSAPPD
jgi:hypothetical protein